MKARSFILNADQRDSRHSADAVPQALERLGAVPGQSLRFERTAGDEIQAALDSADAVVQTIELLSRDSGRWRVGVGLGEVDDLQVATTREGRGQAYLLAREAVEQARSEPGAVVLRADDRFAVPDVQAAEVALVLLRTLLENRTPKGWEVVDLMGRGGSSIGADHRGAGAGAGAGAERSTCDSMSEHSDKMLQSQVAARLEISPSAVSQRLERAGWRTGRRAAWLARHLLDRLVKED